MENLLTLIICTSIALFFMVLTSLFMFKEDKRSNSLSISDLRISSLALIISLLVLNINIYLFPWYIANFNPIKGYFILFSVSVVFIFSLTMWIVCVKHSFKTKKIVVYRTRKRPELRTS